jgi:hypothetical protein
MMLGFHRYSSSPRHGLKGPDLLGGTSFPAATIAASPCSTGILRLARNGQCVLVTNRRQPVALLEKPNEEPAFKPLRAKGKPVSRMIAEERR